MTSKLFMNHAAALLNAAGHHAPFELIPMTGGVNNRIFFVRSDSRIIAVIKHYYHSGSNLRDRLASDYEFSRFLWDHGIRRIPQPLASDPLHHLALFSFIDGKKLAGPEITQQHIDQVLDFYFAINARRASDSAKALPDASEACFTLADHIRLTDRRIQNLQTIKGISGIDKKAELFIRDELVPTWEQVKYTACQHADADNLVLDERIHDCDIRLSPSDFGFHNALVDKDGILIFMDFEYAGWDDPAKVVCDLFCQPHIPLPRRFYSPITEKIVRDLSNPDLQRRRIKLLLPVYKIKWCCIILNEFLPRGQSRRAFMKDFLSPEVNKDEQLKKAMNIISNIRGG